MRLILTLTCPDRPGIVHAVSGFLLAQSGNILEAAQYDDAVTGVFYMRVCFEMGKSDARSPAQMDELFAPLASEFGMKARFAEAARPIPTIIMVSQHGHCLHDLLFRLRSGVLPIEVRAIVSNHRDFYQLAASYNIPFHHIPVKADTKAAAEAKLLDLFESEGGELLVLARYMQVLSSDLCAKYPGRIINIHHSFLPSFVGAKPYHQAYERGVKLIGATCHYVTEELDQGPIIEQDVIRIDHSDSIEDMVRYGKDIEKTVLARGLRYHLEDRVLVHGNKTVVFR